MPRWQRLAGYLHSKPTGPFRRLKGSQRLWHVLDECTMSLSVFRNEEEANVPNKEPMRVIDVAQAAFSLDPNELNQFVVTVDGKDYVLQAESEEAMFLWLSTLQACRNEAVMNDPLPAQPDECPSTTLERKKSQKIQLAKISAPILPKMNNDPSFDVSEVFTSSPVSTRRDWRPSHGTPLPNQQSTNPFQNRPGTPVMTEHATNQLPGSPHITSPSLSKHLNKLNELDAYPDPDGHRETGAIMYSDEMDDEMDSPTLNRENLVIQQSPLLVSTTSQIPDKLKFLNILPKSTPNQQQTNTKLGFWRPRSAISTGNGGVSAALASAHLVTAAESKLVFGFEETTLPGTTPTVENIRPQSLSLVADETECENDKTVVKPPDSQTGTDCAVIDGGRNSGISNGRVSQHFDENATSILSGMNEVMPYYQHEPYLNKLREVQAQLVMYQEREMQLRDLLQQRDATIAELDQRIVQLEDNEEKPVELNIPAGASCGQLREMLKEMEKKRRYMKTRVQFLVSEVRDLSTVRQMLTDHGSKQARYTKRLTSDVIRWKQHFIKLLEACIGALHFDPAHGLLFSDYGKKKCKEKLCELVDEARRKDPSLPTLNKPKNTEYHIDVYGFKHSYSDETVVLHFVCRHLRDFYSRQLSSEDEASTQWAEILKQPNRELSRAELKYLCRAGVPPVHRGGIWRMLIHGEMKHIMSEKGPHYYNRIISEISESQVATRYRKQISLDLMRTMPNNVLFDSIEAPGIQKLQEILQAYSIHNPDIGYCQGMNFLVAVALIFLSKEDAFWCLAAILEKYLPDKYFTCGLINAQVDQLVLKDLLSTKLPKLAEHIRKMEIDISAITLNWFLAVFYDSVPFETLIRIWDIFLLEGSKCLFRFALALLKRNEEMLLLQTDTISFWKCLKSASRLTCDAESLVQTAYEELHPFASRNTISTLQAHHYEVLNKEMSEKQRLWNNVVKEYDEESPEESTVELRRQKSNTERACIQASMTFNKDYVWICHGGRLCSQISEVNVQDCRMKHMDFELDGRVSCCRMLDHDVALFGMMSNKLCAYSAEKKQLLWELPTHDSVTDLVVACWEHEGTNKVFAGLGNGELVVIENAGRNEPQDSVYVFPIGFLRVSSMLLVDNQLWCACGNAVYIFNTATLDFQGHFFISNNALDLILALKLGKHGVWLAVRGSSLIELWDPTTLSRLLLFNTFNDMYVNRREDEEGTFNAHRVTALLPYENTVWVGTGSGQIIVFEIRDGPARETGTSDRFQFTSVTDADSSAVFLPTKSIELSEGMSVLPRMGRRRSSYPTFMPEVSETTQEKLEETFKSGLSTADNLLYDSSSNLHLSSVKEEVLSGGSELGNDFCALKAATCEDELMKEVEESPVNNSIQTSQTVETRCSTCLDDSGLSSPQNDLCQNANGLGEIERQDSAIRDDRLSSNWRDEESLNPSSPKNKPEANTIELDSVVKGMEKQLLINDPAMLQKQTAVPRSDSIASSPSTGIHDMQSTASEESSPVFPTATPMFHRLRHDVRVIEQSTDESLRFHLFAIARNKVSETAIRMFQSHCNENEGRCIISCATFFNDDDAVLRWQKWADEPLIWTNQPIFLYDPTSKSVQLPSYMMNTIKMKKDARRRITVAL